MKPATRVPTLSSAILTIFAVLGLTVVGTGTTSAVAPRGDCSCTEQPLLCDPDKDLASSDIAGVRMDPGPDRLPPVPFIGASGKEPIVILAKGGARMKPHQYINTHRG